MFHLPGGRRYTQCMDFVRYSFVFMLLEVQNLENWLYACSHVDIVMVCLLIYLARKVSLGVMLMLPICVLRVALLYNCAVPHKCHTS